MVTFIPSQLSNPSEAFSWKRVQNDVANYGFDALVFDGNGDIQEQTKATPAPLSRRCRR